MDIVHLRRKGWSEAEVAHALRAMEMAERKRHPWLKGLEHAILWTVILALTSFSVGAALALLPVIVLASPAIVVPMAFLMGTVLGLLLVHALWALKPARHHHLAGTIVLILACTGLVTLLLPENVNPLLVSLPMAAGIIVPYAVHWRHHGSA